jgi:hypothetical protein
MQFRFSILMVLIDLFFCDTFCKVRFYSSTKCQSSEYENELKRAVHVVKKSHALFITAGAGMGVDSGLPDFRSDEGSRFTSPQSSKSEKHIISLSVSYVDYSQIWKGFWRAYPPLKRVGINFVEMVGTFVLSLAVSQSQSPCSNII